MSTAAAAPPRPSGRAGAESARLRAAFMSVSGLVVLALVLGVVASREQAVTSRADLLAWIVACALADMLSVPLWGSVVLTMSLPVSLAAGMVFPPMLAGLVAFIGSVDRRELKGEISLARASYNRSQVALSVIAASAAFHAFRGESALPGLIVAALVALAVDFLVNSTLVVLPASLLTREHPLRILRNLHGVNWAHHAAGYACLGLLAVQLYILFTLAGIWGLAVALAPLILAHEMFARGKRLEEAARAIEEKDRAIVVASEKIADERRDERLAVAGELHDEVLPPLFKVHLMGQVIRRDLDSGRLLDLDHDLPELLAATAAAQEAIRALVSDLRGSPLGPGGLSNTLSLLARQLESESPARIELHLEEVEASSLSQLLTYHVAREALSNAVRHARAKLVTVRLWQEEERIRLVVDDDGVGFDRRAIDRTSHFGLQLMSERVESAQGQLAIDSSPGFGTRVVVSIPTRVH